jgi:hypothetical protein
MIHHVVLWRLKPEAKRDGRILEIERIEQAVDAMRGHMPGLVAIELGINRDSSGDASDLLLHAQFSSWDSLAAYEQHALHQQLRQIIGPLRMERRVVDYETVRTL